MIGGFAGESAGTQYLTNREKEELKEAQEAVSKDPSEANIQRLESAKDMLSVYDALANAGRSAGFSYLSGVKLMPRKPVKPSTQEAEGERGRIDKLLAPKRAAKKPPPAKAAAAAPAPAAPAQTFTPGVPGKPNSNMSAKEVADALSAGADTWFKANPNKVLSRRHVVEMAEKAGITVSKDQASTVAERLRKAYGEKYINGGAKAALSKKSDDPPMGENGMWIKPPKDVDPNDPGNF